MSDISGQPIPVMRTPRTVDIELTARCNLRCTYCYFFENPAVEYHDVATEEWLRFFEECGRMSVMDVTLAGGEPFMRHDLKALLEGIARHRMRFSLLSNGALIDDDIASFIATTRRCNYVQVSLDGSRPETHDVCRGKGSWGRRGPGYPDTPAPQRTRSGAGNDPPPQRRRPGEYRPFFVGGAGTARLRHQRGRLPGRVSRQRR